MNKKNVFVVFGTRPEAIKMAPLIKELKMEDSFSVQVGVTAQHRRMLDQVLSLFEIRPDFDLNIMMSEQDLFDITGKVLFGLRDIFNTFQPDITLVHGDTTTAMATALACFYKCIKIGHVEAGLRTNNLKTPFPEEANRQIIDRLSDVFFVPTRHSESALLNEGISGKRILISGNTVVDSLLSVVNNLRSDKPLQERLFRDFTGYGYDLKEALKQQRRIVLVTLHRRENFGRGFENICRSLREIASSFPDVDLVYPVHLNPNVRVPVFNLLDGLENVFLIEPLEYESFVFLMDKSYMIITDSGGIQEEAPSLGKPVLVARRETERPEAVTAGTVKLVGTNKDVVTRESAKLLSSAVEYQKMAAAHNPYGDGFASRRIVSFLKNIL